jgi:hypothetical protein
MRGYGLPRNKDLECCDIVDIQHYGLKSCAGRVNDNRDYKSYTRNAEHRQSTRRIWKRKERALIKTMIRRELA